MPSNKNAMTRYKILDDLLSDRYHNYSMDDLTEEVNNRLAELYPDSNGVSRRCIEKDIAYIEYDGPFTDVEIERYKVRSFDTIKQKDISKKCLRYATRGFSIFKKNLSDDEEYLLKEALSLLGQFDGLPNLDGLQAMRLSFGAKENGRKIVSFTRNPLEGSNVFGELFTAISHRQVIEIHYHTFHNTDKECVTVLHPYLLKEYNRRWFLYASAESDGKLLCFSLDRINKVLPIPSRKFVNYDGNINEIFEDIIGVTVTDGEIYPIVFWVSDKSKDYVVTKPLHESQRNMIGENEAELRIKYPQLQNGRFFRIDCKQNYELIRELTSFGEDLVVLSPKNIQESAYNRTLSLVEKYQDLRI